MKLRKKIMTAKKYTVYGSDALEARIESFLSVIAEKTDEIFDDGDLVALILGGGYGRAEGGVGVQDGKEKLFNDFDLFVIVNEMPSGKKALYSEKLAHLSEQLEGEIEIDVDFGPLKTLKDLRNLEPTLMMYELIQAHIVVLGDKNVLSGIGPREFEEVPFMEGIRLIMNRSAGLMLSRKAFRKSEINDVDREFISRNICKAIIAMGDVMLMIIGDYNCFYQGRLELVAKHKDEAIFSRIGLSDYYKRAIEYKFRPVDMDLSDESLEEWLEEIIEMAAQVYQVCFDHLAGKAIQSDVSGYLMQEDHSWNSPKDAAKNSIRTLREFGVKGMMNKWFMRNPRQRLYSTLPYLLFGNEQMGKAQVCCALGAKDGSENIELEDCFIGIWEKYN